jgi:hypothetical protein
MFNTLHIQNAYQEHHSALAVATNNIYNHISGYPQWPLKIFQMKQTTIHNPMDLSPPIYPKCSLFQSTYLIIPLRTSEKNCGLFTNILVILK